MSEDMYVSFSYGHQCVHREEQSPPLGVEHVSAREKRANFSPEGLH